MTLLQALYGALLAIALICAAHTPGRRRDDVVYASWAVALGWLLCFWSITPLTRGSPAQAILDLTGQSVDPLRIWALQDAALSCLLAWLWSARRNDIVARVGAVYAVQIAFHAIYQAFPVSFETYSGALDALFLVQLALISSEGGDHIVRNIRDWAARHRGRSVGARGGHVSRTMARNGEGDNLRNAHIAKAECDG